MRFGGLILLGALLAASANAGADPMPAWAHEPLTLSRCVELALQDVVTDSLLRARIGTAEALAMQAHTVPNPVASYTAQDIGLSTPAGPALLHQVMLSVPLLYAYTRHKDARIAAAELQRVSASVDEDRRLLQLTIGRAYHDARLSLRITVIETQAEQLALDLVQKARRRIAHGDAGQIEVVRAQAEALDARRRLEAAQRRHDLDRLTLSILLGAQQPFLVTLQPDSDGESPRVLDLEAPADAQQHFEVLLSKAHATRPDLRAAHALLQRTLEQQGLEQRRVVPLADLQLAGGIRQMATGVGGVITIAMPLPIFDHNRGPRAAAQAAVETARATIRSIERQVALELATALRDWRGAQEALVGIARPAIELRTQALSAAQRQFAEGVVPLLEVITAQRDLLASQRSLAQAECDAGLAAWRLRWVVESQ